MIRQCTPKKLVLFSLLATMVSRQAPVHAKLVLNESRQANVIDAVCFSIITKVIHDYMMQQEQPLSAKASIGIGVGSWLVGECAEMIYKNAYTMITENSLREDLGSSVLCGFKIDHQRLLRRLLTLIPIGVALYVKTRPEGSAQTEATHTSPQADSH